MSDDNNPTAAYVYDVASGDIEPMRTPSGDFPNGLTAIKSVSADGQQMVLVTAATNFGVEDTNEDFDLILYTRGQ